ncbi:MAG: family 1 encapsulin nanocompartment shell protein [Candidatus Bathyarchaeia archaeon]|jgi:uncharacterized linocin/CFP29 family protein
MNNLKYVGKDEVLTTEQGLYIRDRAVEAARRTFQGRKLFGNAIRKIDSSTQTFGYDTLTHGSAAAFDWHWPGKLSIDAVNLARSSVAIPNLHKEFEINKLDLSAANGTLNTTQAESAAYKVAYLEDSLLINGYSADGSNYDINGLYKAAGNTDATDLPWATEANIATSIQNGVGLLMADNILPPYNLVVNPTEYAYMLDFVSGTAVSYFDWVKRVIQGEIYITPAMTAGDAMLVKADPTGAFEYVVAEDITTQTEMTDLKSGNNLFGRVWVRGLPVIYDSNAICTLTAIESP